jgi:hypothetical protein
MTLFQVKPSLRGGDFQFVFGKIREKLIFLYYNLGSLLRFKQREIFDSFLTLKVSLTLRLMKFKII